MVTFTRYIHFNPPMNLYEIIYSLILWLWKWALCYLHVSNMQEPDQRCVCGRNLVVVWKNYPWFMVTVMNELKGKQANTDKLTWQNLFGIIGICLGLLCTRSHFVMARLQYTKKNMFKSLAFPTDKVVDIWMRCKFVTLISVRVYSGPMRHGFVLHNI